MKSEDNNVEIGNPTFMYEPQVNDDDDGDLIDTPFTLAGEKVSVGHNSGCVAHTGCRKELSLYSSGSVGWIFKKIDTVNMQVTQAQWSL